MKFPRSFYKYSIKFRALVSMWKITLVENFRNLAALTLKEEFLKMRELRRGDIKFSFVFKIEQL